jgi:hypothetical protein
MPAPVTVPRNGHLQALAAGHARRQAQKDRGQSGRVEHHDDRDEGVDEKIDAHGLPPKPCKKAL